ncbi:hypothetical protein ACJMK2_025692 [Sinanodonta woodiana]|uniref:Uncharacterized protein n=1 Tax=Sinanodonta woodiana TaxID=1069815 RepID=A0ABD3XHT6_SINWO
MSRVGIGMMKDSLTRAIYKLLEICLWFIKICCCVLMFFDVAGVSNVGVPLVEKIAYIGQAAELVSNIDSHYEDPTLYYENGTYITSWKGNTAKPSDCYYVGKFHMDDKRNIWILRVESEDAGTYSVKFGAKHKRYEVNITLTVKGNLTGEKIEEVRKWLNDHLENIKGSLDRWYLLLLGLLIAMFINEITGNQIREGLIKMKGCIQKKLCKHKVENVSQTPNTVIPMEQPGNFTEEQIMQIRKLLDEQTNNLKKYVEETNSKLRRQSKNIESLSPRIMPSTIDVPNVTDNLVISVPHAPKHPIMEDNLEMSVHQAPGHSFPIMEDIHSSTSKDGQNSNQASKSSTARKLNNHDLNSKEEQTALLNNIVH